MESLEDLVNNTLMACYGIAGDLDELPGEIDTNIKVTTPEGDRFLLRLHAADAEPDEIDLQAAVLAFLEHTAPELGVQRIITAATGEIVPNVIDPFDHLRCVRLTTWLPGSVWAHDISADIHMRAYSAASLGTTLGRLDKALAQFDHPRAERQHRWDLAKAGDHLDLVALIDDPVKRAAVDGVLRRFVDHVAPRLA